MEAADTTAVTQACTWSLAEWMHGLEAQGVLMRRCLLVLGPAYRSEVRERKELAEWIERAP